MRNPRIIMSIIMTFCLQSTAFSTEGTAENNTNQVDTSLLDDMANLAGVPLGEARRVSGAFVNMIKETDESSFIDTLGLTKADAIQMLVSVGMVGFNCIAMQNANNAIDDLGKIGELGQELGEACINNGAEWTACERTVEFARGHSQDPAKIEELVKAGKLAGASDPLDWCKQKCNPLFDAVNKPVRWLGIKHIDEGSCREIRSMVEGCGDAFARQGDFNPVTTRQAAMNQQLEEASRAAGFQISSSGSSAPSFDSQESNLKAVINGVQETARVSVFRVFLVGQATVSLIQFNQLLNTQKALRDAQVSIDGVEDLVDAIGNDFMKLKERFEEINLIDLEIDPDPQTQVKLMRTINVLQAHIQGLDNVLGQKITELEVLKNHVLEPKGRASVHGAVFNFVSAAATFYTTGSMGMVGVNRAFGIGMSCAQAGLGAGNTVAACKAYDQIKTVNGNLATLKSVHEMFNLILGRISSHNDMSA